MSPSRRGAPDHGHPAATSPWEWVAAAVGAALFAGAVMYLLWIALTQPDGPPDLRVEVVGILRGGAGHIIEIEVRNHGHATASSVLVSGELRDAAGGVVEASEVAFDYLPSGSARSGGLTFTQDPASYEILVRAQGYAQP